MTQHIVHTHFPGRLIFIGFGSIGQGVLPLILRHVGGLTPDRITIVTADDAGRAEADQYGIRFLKHPLTRENYRHVLDPLVGRGDFLLNLSVDVSSVALIKLCHEKGALYLDTCIEPWPGGYTDPNIPASRRTNYALREEALELRKAWSNGPTAVLTHGANPGLVSHFVKQALLDVAAGTGRDANPKTRDEWAALSRELGVKVIHIAERDTQVSSRPKMPGEFVNTWSVDGFVSEGSQPAELGWGTHERHFPRDGRQHDFGRKGAIFLAQPGCATRVRTWTPEAKHFHGFLITHGESISISDFLTVRQNDRVLYRPTVHYAYHPSDNAVLSVHEFCGRNFEMQDRKRIMMEDITSGIDELGVLLAGHAKNAYWYGSQLSIAEARNLAPHNSATSLQVTVAALAGMIWAIDNPAMGIVEPDEIDFRRNLEICMPYLGPVVGKYTEWTPLFERGRLFPEDLDERDPWQLKNIRVIY
ncbi:MAG: homospermidine synthase [Gammaproteobacteria bacterium]